MTALAKREADRLAELEDIIAPGREAFLRVGEALREIRDSRLYRESHETFELYCAERWDIGRNYANKQIAAAQVVSELGTDVPTPENEAQARELTRLSDKKARQHAWREAAERAESEDRPVTAADVKRAVKQRRPKAPVGKAAAKAEPEPTPPQSAGDGAASPSTDTSHSWPTERREERIEAACRIIVEHVERIDPAANPERWMRWFPRVREALETPTRRARAATNGTPAKSEADVAAEADQLDIELRRP